MKNFGEEWPPGPSFPKALWNQVAHSGPPRNTAGSQAQRRGLCLRRWEALGGISVCQISPWQVPLQKAPQSPFHTCLDLLVGNGLLHFVRSSGESVPPLFGSEWVFGHFDHFDQQHGRSYNLASFQAQD